MAKKKKVEISHRDIMAALGKAVGEERGKLFREDPNDETRDVIVKKVKSNLNKLMEGKKL